MISEAVATLSVEDGVATLRLDRPKVNALDFAMQQQIAQCAREAAERDDVAAVVVYGGERAFAAGADIKEMAGASYADMAVRAPQLQACFAEVARIPKPTVAAITGYALGGGCELALCCDFRVAADNAVLGQPEVLLGIMPGAGGSQRLPRLVGVARAKDLLFSGRQVDAAEAQDIGLVDLVVPADEVYATAVSWMRRFVGYPPLALRAIKEAVDLGGALDLETALALESRLFASLFATEDRTIGMTSFIADGPGKARFVGR